MTGQQLLEAARDGDAAKVRTLLSTQGAQSFFNYQDAHGATPLFFAAANGHEAVTKQLIYARCSVDHQDMSGFTALHIAAARGREAVTEELLAASCNVHLQDNDGSTALQFAEDQGHAGIATLIRNRKETPLLGRRVVINGLVAKPELNGRTGTAVSFDDGKGRYSVELDSTSSSFKIKPCNLLPTQVCSVALCSLLCSHCADTTKSLLI
jgi:ankyrin repeat protein